jgi:hypothetical protein
MSTASTPPDRRSGPPLWLVEGLDIVESRRRIVLGIAGLIIVVGLLLALLAPSVLPPTPLVGAAVAFAALLIGVAAAIVVDSSDLRVRGPRHVVAAGGELVAVLPVAGDAEAADELATVVLEAREPDHSMLLGLAASSLDIAATLRWTDALGVALARRGVSVLRVDLASGRSDTPGLAEVAAGERRLTEVVDYESGMLLARLGAGGDHRDALAALVDLPAKLPRDLQVLLVALPIAASRGVVQAARGLDHVLVVAERGDTSRVDLIAGLDALRAADLQAQVILLDDLTAGRIASGGSGADVVPVRPRTADDTGEVADDTGEVADEQPTAVLEERAADEVAEEPTAVSEEPEADEVGEQPTAVSDERGAEEIGQQPTAVLEGLESADLHEPADATEATVALAPGFPAEPGVEREPEAGLEADREPESGPEEASDRDREPDAGPEVAPEPEPDRELEDPSIPVSVDEPIATTEGDEPVATAEDDEHEVEADQHEVDEPDADEPDAVGPPPPPAAALAAAAARTDQVAAPTEDPTVRLAAPEAAERGSGDEPTSTSQRVETDDASARAAAIVEAVMADHRRAAEQARELAEADRGTPRE